MNNALILAYVDVSTTISNWCIYYQKKKYDKAILDFHRIFNEFYLFKSNKKDPLKSNFKFFKNSSLLKKVFKYNKKLDNKINKDKVTIYN